jgi:hypothetical protein
VTSGESLGQVSWRKWQRPHPEMAVAESRSGDADQRPSLRRWGATDVGHDRPGYRLRHGGDRLRFTADHSARRPPRRSAGARTPGRARHSIRHRCHCGPSGGRREDDQLAWPVWEHGPPPLDPDKEEEAMQRHADRERDQRPVLLGRQSDLRKPTQALPPAPQRASVPVAPPRREGGRHRQSARS